MREQIIIHNFTNTGPVVNWLKLPNSDEKLLTLVSSINVPAIGAAITVQPYKAVANDEISLQIGDIVSVIEMPDSNLWWRGKRLFDVGYFPSYCVELIKEGSTVLNPDDLIQVIKNHHAGSVRFKHQQLSSQSSSTTNNENENPLVNLLKCRQLRDDEKLASIERLSRDRERSDSNLNNACTSGYYSVNDGEVSTDNKKPLIECQTNFNSINIKHSTPNNTRILCSISPLNIQQTDHHTSPNRVSNSTNTATQHSIHKVSLTSDISSPNSVFQRRNRISSTLSKSLNSSIASHGKPLCVNLFNNTTNQNTNSIDTSDQRFCSPLKIGQQQSTNHHYSISSPINNCPNNSLNQSSTNNSPQLMANKRSNKLSSFLRSIINRNNNSTSDTTRSQFDKRGTLSNKRQDKSNVLINLRKNKKLSIKNTVFGCELNDYLNRTGRRIPLVLQCCCEFLEENGIVHGVYRLSGVNSNIQKLIKCFDDDESPDWTHDIFLQDVHCVSSLLKLYFRELPNPLLTFELYDNFVKAIQPSYDPNGLSSTSAQNELPEKTKLSNLIKVLRMLPLNHYVALEYLVLHLKKISNHSEQTGMTIKNLAIVWSPNLLRCKELETQGGIGALQCIGIQAVLTEYLIRFADELFIEESRPFNYFEDQDDEFNGSFVAEHNSSRDLQDSISSNKDQSINQDKSNQLDDTVHSKNESIQQHNDDCSLETDENNFDKSASIESKFTIESDNGLLPLPVARKMWRKKCDLLDNDDQTLDQLVSSKMKDDANTSKELFIEPCLSFTSNKLVFRTDSDDTESHSVKAEEENCEPTFGVLGKFGSIRGRKRFGNLDLIDEHQNQSTDLNSGVKQCASVRKRRSLIESEANRGCDNVVNRFGTLDRFKYKGFDELSDDECKSNNSLKLVSSGKTEQVDEPLQRYHTILNTKHFYKNKITPKENSNLMKRTPNKWPSIKL